MVKTSYKGELGRHTILIGSEMEGTCSPVYASLPFIPGNDRSGRLFAPLPEFFGVPLTGTILCTGKLRLRHSKRHALQENMDAMPNAPFVPPPDAPDRAAQVPRIWALLGPRAGDNNQVLALSEAVGGAVEAKPLRYWPPRLLTPSNRFAVAAEQLRHLLGGQPFLVAFFERGAVGSGSGVGRFSHDERGLQCTVHTQ